MQIGDFEIGSKCFIVAELSGNMGGNLETARHMVDAAKACGADAVKIQTYKPREMPDKDEIVKGCGKWDGMKWLNAYYRTYMPWFDQLKLRKHAKSRESSCSRPSAPRKPLTSGNRTADSRPTR